MIRRIAAGILVLTATLGIASSASAADHWEWSAAQNAPAASSHWEWTIDHSAPVRR